LREVRRPRSIQKSTRDDYNDTLRERRVVREEPVYRASPVRRSIPVREQYVPVDDGYGAR